jgi:hypothetical protein
MNSGNENRFPPTSTPFVGKRAFATGYTCNYRRAAKLMLRDISPSANPPAKARSKEMLIDRGAIRSLLAAADTFASISLQDCLSKEQLVSSDNQSCRTDTGGKSPQVFPSTAEKVEPFPIGPISIANKSANSIFFARRAEVSPDARRIRLPRRATFQQFVGSPGAVL